MTRRRSWRLLGEGHDRAILHTGHWKFLIFRVAHASDKAGPRLARCPGRVSGSALSSPVVPSRYLRSERLPMASEYDEHIANLRRVNDLLQQALQQVQALLRQVELENRESVQDNEPVEGAPASPPSA